MEKILVPNFDPTLKCVIVLFEIYQIRVFAAIQLTYISILRADGSFEILKSKDLLSSIGLDQFRTENVFPEKILYKRWQTNSQNYVRYVSP